MFAVGWGWGWSQLEGILRYWIVDWNLQSQSTVKTSRMTYMKFFHTGFLAACWLGPKVQHPKREGRKWLGCLYDLVSEVMQCNFQHILSLRVSS